MSREPASELSDDELVQRYKSYYNRVENDLGVSTNDLRYFSDLERELDSRGAKIRQKVEVSFPEEEVRNQ